MEERIAENGLRHNFIKYNIFYRAINWCQAFDSLKTLNGSVKK
jgi:hypothetical protein